MRIPGHRVAILCLASIMLSSCAKVTSLKLASTHNVDLSRKYTLVVPGVSSSTSTFDATRS